MQWTLRTWVKRLSFVATVGMFLVLVMGATVTSTGSGQGCGRSWPLCHGQFIPELAIATLIEYSHRAVSGVEGLLVLALTVGALAFWGRHWEIRVLAPLALITVVVQAGLGAWAVLAPQTPAVMAAHFGISLLSFASVFLTMRFLYEVDSGADALRDRPPPAGFGPLVWATLVYVQVVVYLGAYVRHAHVELACIDWPLCNGQIFPGFEGPVGIVFAHRLAALGSVLLLGGLAGWAWRFRAARPDLAWGAVAAFGLVVLQSLSGALVVLSRLSLYSALSHAAIMALLFVSLSYLCLKVLPRPAFQPLHRGSAAVGLRGSAASG